jgi:hypothetical protein
MYITTEKMRRFESITANAPREAAASSNSDMSHRPDGRLPIHQLL